MSTVDEPIVSSSVTTPDRILDPGLYLTLRLMRYPVFYDTFRDGIRNTWTVEEVDFQTDLADLRQRLTRAEAHVIQRLVSFFASGDSIVFTNLVLNRYKHVNSPEAVVSLATVARGGCSRSVLSDAARKLRPRSRGQRSLRNC
jgi:ribonucleoside-diphosphate reductase beta chain